MKYLPVVFVLSGLAALIYAAAFVDWRLGAAVYGVAAVAFGLFADVE